MRRSKIKDKILLNIDINQYILDRVRRKLHPMAVCQRIKLKNDYDSLVTNLKVESNDKFIKSERINCQISLTSRKSKKDTRNKMKSQIQKPFCEYQFEQQVSEQFSFDNRLRDVSNRALQYIQSHKLKKKLYYRKVNEQLCQSPRHPKHHKRIITSLSKPFDFGQVYNQVKNNEFLLSIPTSNLNLNQKQSWNEHKKSKQDNNQQQRYKQRIKFRSKNVEEIQRAQKRKITLIKTQELQQEDKIDVQFKQGLVQEIYEAKRVKFRKKLNNIRSRKNIYDGKLYFLNE